MALQWLAADLLTGAITAYLPTLAADQPYRRTLGQYETNTATLIIPDVDPYTGKRPIDPSWPLAVEPWSSVLIAYRGAPGSEVIEWGGIVNQGITKLGNAYSLPLITGEGYLDRCNVGDYTTDPTNVGTTKDQNVIVSDLIAQFVAAPVLGIPGVPVTVRVIGGAGTHQLRTYHDYDDKTVYACLQELNGISGGCEWTMHWEWLHDSDQDRIVPVLDVGNRIGSAVLPGRAPDATFEASDLIDATVTSDWSYRAGANVVMASLGSGPGRGQARSVAAAPGRRPHLEYRFSPSVPVTDQAALQKHADGQRDVMQNGKQSIQLTSAIKPGLTYGVDWLIGDDIGFRLTGPTYPEPAQGVTRCIGYESTDTTIQPIILGS
ncbi:MAG: hypothetical protein QOH56_2785 [Pseudonocardiales bacterium]|jgi:hypothetical protein|nr:hypothetical protein [Pseudonocardiales bacterium]